MRQRVRAAVLAITCFALGAAVQRFYDVRRPATPQAPQAVTAPGPANPIGEAKGEVRVTAIPFDRAPLWAYGFDEPAKPGDKAAPQAPPSRNLRPNQDPGEQTRPRHVEGSTATYSLVDVRDGQNVIDWFPGDHPPMPGIIAHGPARLGNRTRGCGSCHLPNGKGRPENASPAALPVTYVKRQIEDFRNGLRYTADPRKPNTNTMIELAKAMTDDEVKAAAEYFAAMPWTPWTRVVETNLVPKTRIAGNLFLATEEARTEPIAGRIIEVPENEEQAETLRNPRSGFVAYVPVGSIRKGKDLVTTGGMKIVGNQIVQGKTTACGTCHGLDLMGVADVPPIAGRSPSYMVRQMWDMQQGTRNGASAQLMKLVVANLTEEDMVAIAAYVSSRLPPGAGAHARRSLSTD
ncbi:MAG: c-type cytochrome [Acidobacteriota bacterium]